jgi:hypothetical protein
MKKFLKAGALFAALGLVAACGGGGSDGGGGGGDTSDDVCGGATMGCITGVIQDGTGAAPTGAITVTSQATGAAAQVVGKAVTNLTTTNAQGWFTADNLEQGEQVLCFTGADYVKKCVTVNIRAKETTPLPPVMLPTRGNPITVNNVESGTAQAQDPNTSAMLDFNQANSVCDASGTAVTGSVDCYLSPVDSSAASMPETAPNTFAALDAGTGLQGTMVSSALMEATCEQNGAEVNVCTGKTVGVRVPLYGTSCADADRNPANIASWFYDEADGNWQAYTSGNFTKSACATGETDQWYNGAVEHFTWINGDKWKADSCLTGLVYTAGTTLTGTNVTVECWGSGWRNSVQVGTDGRFCIAVPNGYAYTCKVGDTSGWIAQSDWVTGTATSPVVQFPVDTCPAADCQEISAFTFASPIMSTTLTWGENPRDLDSHMVGTGVHVWYSDKAKDMSTKGSLNAAPYIALDTDDVTSYGPEVTTVMPSVADGKYCFFVHLFSGTGDINQTSTDQFGNAKVATVTVTGNGVAQTYTAPSGSPSIYWRVYTVEFAAGQIVSGSFTAVNDYVLDEPTDCTW